MDYSTRISERVWNQPDKGELEAEREKTFIDDIVQKAHIERELLQSLNGIKTALDGAAALKMAAEKKYDIIFIDRRMPEMDGYEVLRRIKGDTAGVNADSVFILLTADEGNGIREAAIVEGFTDYMSKPFDSSTLEKIVKKYLPGEKKL